MIIMLITLFGRQPKKINRPVMQIPPIRKTYGKWARNNEQKAQRFEEHLEQIYQPLGSQEEKAMISEDIVQENEELKLATTTEVKNVINNNINPKKITGV